MSLVGKQCTYEGCTKTQPKLTRGWCAKHYQRWRRNGDASKIKAQISKPKTCDFCGELFRPKRLQYATACSGKCNLRRWRRDNPEHSQRIKQEWRRKNPGSEVEGHRLWRKNNPERVAHHKATRYARERDAEGSYTIDEWEEVKQRFNNLCAGCFEPRLLTRDHIVPLSKGGSNYITNIQPLCRPCNSRKNNRELVCL